VTVIAIIGGQLTMLPADTAFSGAQDATNCEAPEDLCSLQRTHHEESKVTRGEHRGGMHPRRILGDQVRVKVHVQVNQAQATTLCRVFSDAQPESLRRLGLVPLALSALLQSFLARLLFIR
jgi:hypothetical protein